MLKRMFILMAPIAIIAAIFFQWEQVAGAIPSQGSCATPDITVANSLVDIDTIWSGEIYVDANYTIRGNSTLTIEAGTRVIFCDDYQLSIGGLFSPAQLVAVGTSDQPIVFEPDLGVTNWNGIYFSDSLAESSSMRHVEIRGAGSNENEAAVVISSRHAIITQTSPIIDNVIISDSASYGLLIDINEDFDPSPPAISNLTITGSANAPILTDPAGVTALGANITTTNNVTDAIMVSLGGIRFDSHWRDHGVPYVFQTGINARNNDPFSPFSTWRIDPGVELHLPADVTLNIGGLFSESRLDWQGTEEKPIVIKPREDARGPWGTLVLEPFDNGLGKHTLTHVTLQNGGGDPASQRAMLFKGDSVLLEMDQVTLKNSSYIGLQANNGNFTINNSRIENNVIGIQYFVDRGTQGKIRNTIFKNNSEQAINNWFLRDNCLDAAGNYWGASDGPMDSSLEGTSGCLDAGSSNSGSGDSISNGIIYFPWLTSDDIGSVEDHSSISSGEKLWILANGLDKAEIVLTVRDASGAPLPNQSIEFRATRGTLSTTTGTTDNGGRLRTTLTSTETGSTNVTALNLTTGQPVAASLSLFFWEGGGETGGLINQTGAPYASPALVVKGEPFEAGLPVLFTLPMRNGQTNALQVDVDYYVQNFGIASGRELVSSASELMSPNEFWDAPGGFTPADTAHRCVIFDVTYSDASGRALSQSSGSFGGSQNLKNPKPPCSDLNADKLVPSKPGGLGAVFKHFGNVLDQTNKVSRCLDQTLTFRNRSMFQLSYESPVVLQTLTPPTYVASMGESQALVDAINTLSQTAADISALNLALAESRQKTTDAAQAGDWQSAADRLEDLRNFEAQRVTKLQSYVAEMNAVIALLDATTLDTLFEADDYTSYLADLKANGFDAETIAYHTQSGLSPADIDAMLAATIAALEAEITFSSLTFRDILIGMRDDASAEALGQAEYLAIGVATGSSRGDSQIDDEQSLIGWGEIVETFEVGNPTTITDTVELEIRAGGLPVQWSVSLDKSVFELGPNETTSVTIRVDTGDLPVVVDDTIYFGVEGLMNGEFIGGVMFEHRVPVNPAADPRPAYLPFIYQ